LLWVNIGLELVSWSCMLDGRDKRLIILPSIRLVRLGGSTLSVWQHLSGMSDRARSGRGEGRLLLVSRNTLETVRVVIVTSWLDSASWLKDCNARKSSNSRMSAVIVLVRLAVGGYGPGAGDL
jgi:hypothetical protein